MHRGLRNFQAVAHATLSSRSEWPVALFNTSSCSHLLNWASRLTAEVHRSIENVRVFYFMLVPVLHLWTQQRNTSWECRLESICGRESRQCGALTVWKTPCHPAGPLCIIGILLMLVALGPVLDIWLSTERALWWPLSFNIKCWQVRRRALLRHCS